MILTDEHLVIRNMTSQYQYTNENVYTHILCNPKRLKTKQKHFINLHVLFKIKNKQYHLTKITVFHKGLFHLT